MTNKKQFKATPLELLFEIFKAINGGPNLVIKQKEKIKRNKNKTKFCLENQMQ